MATIEQCALGARVRRKDGLHGDAIVVGRILDGRAEGRVRRSSHHEAGGEQKGSVVEIHYDRAWKGDDGNEHSGECLDPEMLELVGARKTS